MQPIRLSRRTLLRGAGLGVALPTLEAMLTDGGLLVGRAGAQPRKPPKRLVIFFIPNGVPMMHWTPATTGADYAMPKVLESLAPFRDDMNVLTGLDLETSGAGGGHERGTSGFATCVKNSEAGAGGPSVEQVAAKHLGDTTTLRSLVVSDNVCPARYAVNLSFISYTGPGAPVPPIRTTRPLYDKLFKDPSAGATIGPSELVLRRRSVLDFVKTDITRLERVLGGTDRQRIDAHLTGVRELERQLALTSPATPAASCGAFPTPALDGVKYSDESEKLLLDMTAFALKCDLTRFASFMVAFGGASAGPCPGEHALVHARDYAKTVPIKQHQVSLFAHFLKRLKDDTAREADGTVLDNSIIYFGCEMSDGSAHSNRNTPVVLAGKAGGQVRTGRHIVYPARTNIARMMLAMLKLTGAPVDEFGEVRAPLDGLT